MTWARRRKFIYLGTIALIFIILIVWFLFAHFYKPPNCFDGLKNQDEVGVDCGGTCTLLCADQYVPLNILWSRFSKVSDGVYNVLAYIENPNSNARADNLDYVFKLYDKDGTLLSRRSGKTFAGANKTLVVFEAEMQTGNKIPDRVDFSFTSEAVWSKQISAENGLAVSESVISKEETAPRLSASVFNKTANKITNIEAVAIVYDLSANATAFSRTIIDYIEGKNSQTIYFNWPKAFASKYSRTEIILKVLK